MRQIPILCAVLAMSTGVAHGQPGELQWESEADSPEGLFVRGSNALQEESFADAVLWLERSLELHPYLPTAHNLSLALEGNGDPVRAARLCVAIVEGRYGSAEEGLRSSVQQRLERLDALLAHVEIVSSSPGAWVRIGSESITNATSVAESVHLRFTPGEYRLMVGAPGYRARTIALLLEAGVSRRVEANLEQEIAGRLIVEAVGHRVSIAGVSEGEDRVDEELLAGVYDVSIVGLEESRRTVTLDAGETTRITLIDDVSGRRTRRIGWSLGAASLLVAAGVVVALVLTRPDEPAPSLFRVEY